jgi:hypothetical protein
VRRVLTAAALAAVAFSGLTSIGASAEGPLECNNPKYQRACEIVTAITDIGGLPPVPTVNCNHPWNTICDKIHDLIGDGGY